jgi:hypothetical protein
VDAIHIRPEQVDSHGRMIPPRFDTVLVQRVKLNAAHIVSQTYCIVSTKTDCSSGYQVAQIRVVFQIPSKVREQVFLSSTTAPPTTHLAYVEWFSSIPTNPDPNHLMYKVSRLMHNGRRHASIIPVDSIISSVHLFPLCRPPIPPEWNSFTVLEHCQNFYLNPFSDRDVYLMRNHIERQADDKEMNDSSCNRSPWHQ